MTNRKKTIISSAVVLTAALILTLAGNAVRTARAAFLVPQISSLGINSTEVPKLGVIELTGVVDAVAADSYTVSGLVFRFDALTIISGAPVVGDSVEVKALLLPDLSRYALKIEKNGYPAAVPAFEFNGLVETIGTDAWVISGEQIQISTTSKVDDGLAVGDLVEVKGTVESGQMIAGSVSLIEKSGTPAMVVIFGTVESIDGGVYTISGKTVNTDAATVVNGTLAVGSLVKVQAVLNSDGTYLASGISLVTAPPDSGSSDDSQDEDEDEDSQDDQDEDQYDDQSGKEFEFTGTIESLSADSLVVNGVTITISEKTEIDGNLQVGVVVKVEARTMMDGTTLAHEIEVKSYPSMTPGDDQSKSGEDSDSSDSSDDSYESEHQDDSHDGDHEDEDEHEDDHEGGDESGGDSFGFGS